MAAKQKREIPSRSFGFRTLARAADTCKTKHDRPARDRAQQGDGAGELLPRRKSDVTQDMDLEALETLLREHIPELPGTHTSTLHEPETIAELRW